MVLWLTSRARSASDMVTVWLCFCFLKEQQIYILLIPLHKTTALTKSMGDCYTESLRFQLVSQLVLHSNDPLPWGTTCCQCILLLVKTTSFGNYDYMLQEIWTSLQRLHYLAMLFYILYTHRHSHTHRCYVYASIYLPGSHNRLPCDTPS